MRCPGRFGGRSVVHIGRRRGISKAVAVHYSLLVGSLVVPLLADKYIVKDEGRGLILSRITSLLPVTTLAPSQLPPS